jgi:outer membrane protein assembly factor BamB/predicted phosphodiesterase
MPRPLDKKLAVFLFGALFALPLAAQEAIFAVVADTHVGSGSAAADLVAVVRTINVRKDIDFTVVVGDVAEKGRPSEYEEARRILAELREPCRVLPGNHDAHWVGHGLTNFRQAWPDDRFLLQKGASYYLGLDSGELGHLTPEDLVWLTATLAKIPPSASIFVFLHHPPEYVDNWFKAHNLLRARRAVVFGGHVHKTQVLSAGGITAVTAKSTLSGKNPDAWGFLLVKVWADAVEFLDVAGTAAPVPVGAVRRAEWKPAPALADKPLQNLAARLIWKADLAVSLPGPAVADGDRIYAADAKGRLTCFDNQGGVRWKAAMGEAMISSPTIAGDTLWAVSAGGWIAAFDAGTGRVLRSRNLGAPATSVVGFIAKGPSGDPAIIIATLRGDEGALSCFDARTLEPVWVREAAGGIIQSRPLAVGGRIVYGSWDGRVHALDVRDGRELWAWLGSPNFYYSPAGCEPQTDGRCVFVCAPDGFVTALNLETGNVAWREKSGAWESLGISPDGKRLLVKGLAEEFRVLDAETGRLIRRTFPAHGKSDILPAEPLEWNGRILYGGQNGFIYEIGPEGTIAPLMFLGAAGVHSLQRLKDNIFLASNLDGQIAVFERK